ncbi:unnamed protein product (macronuclear) [Paramecium tetraurelia]|uniref:V-type proton ATPase subunit F n=1 Tax=Paramecium tetraurelia TaxID=5888 RepID=A0DGS0_PARTE|nr:uncharacterized protein GSPATT00002366001 [Paramecium tetraurelia]CAK82237.1 unnamed protein product [Paramecium tetraurelia]|eukprot:XP_001449634.1 hypothetical protein (macronuclear) [Paramecium tetraurelia strain d4-2]
MSKKTFKKSEGTSLVSIIGDEDTVTGFLLTGIGEKNIKGETNFLYVNSLFLETDPKLIEATFQNFLKHPNIAVILVTQFVAENYLRHIINQYDAILPTILEIPSKEYPYEAKKDTIIQRAHRLLYGTDIQ